MSIALGESVDGEADDGEVDGDVRAIEDGKTEGDQLKKVGHISQLPAVDAITERSSKQASQGQTYPEIESFGSPNPAQQTHRNEQAE